MNTPEAFLTSAIKQFLYYKTLGEKAMDQLEPAQLFYVANEDTNSIAIIVNHLHGNMLSRWTDFLTTDGEKEWRKRDEEFENASTTLSATEQKADLLKKWNEGWDCLFNALNELKPEQLSDIIYIRNEGHTVVEAINRQLAHYPYHVGQIVFYAKMFKKGEWTSLSIPKNKSTDYNANKFSKEKSIKNFTDDELNSLK
ncbi:MAG: DUF1572 family protein [Bacteroidota bacterium]